MSGAREGRFEGIENGAGKPTTKIIEEAADRWAFLVKVLGVPRPGK